MLRGHSNIVSDIGRGASTPVSIMMGATWPTAASARLEFPLVLDRSHAGTLRILEDHDHKSFAQGARSTLEIARDGIMSRSL